MTTIRQLSAGEEPKRARMAIPLVVLTMAGLVSACVEMPVYQDDTVVQKVIYGDDNRLDYYDVTVPWQRQLIEASVAVLVDADDVEISGNSVTLEGDLYTDVCDSERFYGQPSPGWCSGTLVDRQLLMTAGHCVDECASSLRFVFRFYYQSDGELQTMTGDDVYECEEVLAYSEGGADYSIIKLDRPVASHLAPAPVRISDSRLEESSPVTAIGFPKGLPAKAAGGATVVDPGSGSEFEANLDTYAGNSGSGVFTDDGKVAGIHVNGRSDFTEEGDCDVSNHFPDSLGSEGNTYTFEAFSALCAAGVNSGPYATGASVVTACVRSANHVKLIVAARTWTSVQTIRKTEPGECGCGVPEGTCSADAAPPDVDGDMDAGVLPGDDPGQDPTTTLSGGCNVGGDRARSRGAFGLLLLVAMLATRRRWLRR